MNLEPRGIGLKPIVHKTAYYEYTFQNRIGYATPTIQKSIEETSVADPKDPYVFFASGIRIRKYQVRSGYFFHQAKIVRKI
jgi:hypothetical protein